MQHELILLSHNRLPAQNALMLGNEDVTAFLNGYTALWHPAVMCGASGPPRVCSPYDHEQPAAGHVYAVPESPPSMLPDDWDDRVRNAGSITFHATTDRQATLDNLKAALRAYSDRETRRQGDKETRRQGDRETGRQGEKEKSAGADSVFLSPCLPVSLSLWELTADQLGPFFGIGLGLLVLDALFEAMERENLIPRAELWQDVQQAILALAHPDKETGRQGDLRRIEDGGSRMEVNQIENHDPPSSILHPPSSILDSPRLPVSLSPCLPDACRQHLQTAAGRLLTARETLYPAAIRLIDICLLDEKHLDQPFPASFASGIPFNLVGCTALLEKLAAARPDLLAALRERLANDTADFCGGPYLEREDAILPVESQIWNLLKGLEVSEQLLGRKAAHLRPQAFRRSSTDAAVAQQRWFEPGAAGSL